MTFWKGDVGGARRPSTTCERRRTLSWFGGASALALLTVACGFVGSARAASNFTVLFPFTNIRGAVPRAGLVADGAGNLYGTTVEGGRNNDGVVFKLSPPAVGKTAWTETVLFSFDGTDGQNPRASLIADGAGNLYGTTPAGGKYQHGVVFELAPPAEGQTTWTETVLHSFNSRGEGPAGGLMADGAGNLYGTSSGTGANVNGVVFELSPPAAGKTAWTKTALFSFDGINGSNRLGVDRRRYGQSLRDNRWWGTNGNYNGGVVIELSPPAAGHTAWTETVLQTFSYGAPNGSEPQAGLVLDKAGNLYGSAEGGSRGYGIVFELSPPVVGRTGLDREGVVFFRWRQWLLAGIGSNCRWRGQSLRHDLVRWRE